MTDLPWPLPDRTDLRDRLLAAYSTGRGYHDARHLAEVLARLDELAAGGCAEAGSAEVVLAAWFHDAVYDGRADAEERSARLAEAELTSAGHADAGHADAGHADAGPAGGAAGGAVNGVVNGVVNGAEVARLVRLTEHHDPAPDDRNGAALCDADLAILAATPERYREYAAGVRREYAALSDADFRAGRLAVLEDLAGRDRLFRTAHAREHWEPLARENLAAEITRLRSPD